MKASFKEGRVSKRYSEAFKREVVRQIESGELSAGQAKRRYELTGGSTVYKWLERYGSYTHKQRVMRIEKPGEVDRVKQLEKEKQELQAALATAHLKILALESTIEVTEETYGIRAKKTSV